MISQSDPYLVLPISFPSLPPGSEVSILSSSLNPVQSLSKHLLRVYYGPCTVHGPVDAVIKNRLRSLLHGRADILWDFSVEASPVGHLSLTAWCWLFLPWPGLLPSALSVSGFLLCCCPLPATPLSNEALLSTEVGPWAPLTSSGTLLTASRSRSMIVSSSSKCRSLISNFFIWVSTSRATRDLIFLSSTAAKC